MKLSKIVSYAILLIVTAACTVNIRCMDRIVPQHKGVDPQMVAYVDQYLTFAKNAGIKFRHVITVGFADIKKPNVIGLCHFGGYWREIDIDRNYWSRSSELSRQILIFHELTHGYCGRNHDFDNKKAYGKINEDPFMHKDFGMTGHFSHNPEGYFEDRCPKSIMFPQILSDKCIKDHYRDYVTEMFNNCEAW